MRVAADRLAAIAVVGQQLRLVADADLPHFDAGLEFAGQVLDQLAEIDALLGQEIEDEPFAAEEVLDVDEFHLQLAFVDEIVAAIIGRFFAGLAFEELHAILVGHRADDLALGRLLDELDGARRRLAQDLADFQAALGLDDDVLAAAILALGAGFEVAEEAHDAVTDDVVLCYRITGRRRISIPRNV